MKTTVCEPHKSSLGMDANVAVVITVVAMAVASWLPYLSWLAWAVPVVFYVLEKNSSFVRFYAAQTFVLGLAAIAVSIVISILASIIAPSNVMDYLTSSGAVNTLIFLSYLSRGIGIAFNVIELFLLFNAFGYKQVELPVLGPLAGKASGLLDSFIRK